MIFFILLFFLPLNILSNTLENLSLKSLSNDTLFCPFKESNSTFLLLFFILTSLKSTPSSLNLLISSYISSNSSSILSNVSSVSVE